MEKTEGKIQEEKTVLEAEQNKEMGQKKRGRKPKNVDPEEGLSFWCCVGYQDNDQKANPNPLYYIGWYNRAGNPVMTEDIHNALKVISKAEAKRMCAIINGDVRRPTQITLVPEEHGF